MKKLNIKIVLLVLVLVVTNILLVTTDRTQKLKKLPDGTLISNQMKDSKWEYVKNRLFSGKGETEFVYKINELDKNAPILIAPLHATKQDSLAINEIIDELRVIIPNRTIDYFKKFAGITYSELDKTDSNRKPINGTSSSDLIYSTIQLNFEKRVNPVEYREEDIIKTVLVDGDIIERTNLVRLEVYKTFPGKVWFQLKETLPNEKRKQYIEYELLRNLCYIHPHFSYNRNQLVEKGIFFTPTYIPEVAEINDYDKFLLQKLYEDDFLEQFKTYLNTSYSWIYANNFLNKSFASTIAWSIIICIGLFAFSLLFSFSQKKKFKYAYLNYFVPIYFIWLYLINSITIYVFITTLSESFSPLHGLIFFLIASIAAFITSIGMFFAETKWIDKVLSFGFKLIFKVLFTFFAFNLPVILLFCVAGSPKGFIEFYLPIFIFTIMIAVGRGLLIYLNHFSQSLVKQKEVELSQLKELHAQAETKLLQSQINPHFLYNSLNSIASLAPIDAKKTQKMAHSLSDLFKYSINRKGKKTSTIFEEVEMVKTYLEIEKIRFGDRLQFTIDVNKDLENHDIPLFLIQPLVENAVKHGVSKKEGQGEIVLKIEKVSNNIVISVSDNGPNFSEGLVSGHGLQTVYDLLRLSFGDKASLNWTNTPEKMITIIMPENILHD